MPQPYLGEIRIFAGNFAPADWMFCEGQLLFIAENEPLFLLIGTTYGGDGQNTFALPDLRGRIPIHEGNGLFLADTGGAEEVILTVNHIPVHSHALRASGDAGNALDPAGNVLANSQGASLYVEDPPNINLSSSCIDTTGGGQTHTNCQPYFCLNFIISLSGLFPLQS